MGDLLIGWRPLVPDMTEGASGHRAWHPSRCLAPRGARRRGVGLTRHRPPRACAASAMGCRSVGRAIRWQRRGLQAGSYFVLRTVRGVTRQLVLLRLVRARARKRDRKARPARGTVEVGQARKGGADMLSPAQPVPTDAGPVGGAPLSVCATMADDADTLEHSQGVSVRGALALDTLCEDESNPLVQFVASVAPPARGVSYFGRSDGRVSAGGFAVGSRVNPSSLQVIPGTQHSLRSAANVFVPGAEGHATRVPPGVRSVRFSSDTSAPCPRPSGRASMASRLVQLVVLLLLQVVPDGATLSCATPPSTSSSEVSIGVGGPAVVPIGVFSCGEFGSVHSDKAGTTSVPARDAPGNVLEGPLTFDNDNYLPMQVDETVCSPAEEAMEMETVPKPGTPPSPTTPPESFKWSRRRARRVGHLQAHVRFLQHLFRGYRRLRPGCWGMRGGLHSCPSPVRPVTHFRCRGGMCLAHDSEYREMATRAASVADWYDQYALIYARLRKRAPRSYHPYSAAGSDALGVRQSHGVPFGTDHLPQPDFIAAFGSESFEVSDATSQSGFLGHVTRTDPTVVMASPPCKAHSTSDMQKRSTAPDLIGLTRDHCRATGRLFVIENVKGAAAEMEEHAVLIYGSYFGLRVDRPRFFEANFDLHVDEFLRVPGLALRSRGCLGPRRKWRRMDPFGRPEMTGCCDGTLYPMQGLAPHGFTSDEGAWAMGIDPGMMSFERMTQAIPPAYGRWVFGQACMAACAREYGVPVITYDEMQLRPREARARLSHWLRGAGGDLPEQGMQMLPRAHQPEIAEATEVAGAADEVATVRLSPADMVAEVEFREVYYAPEGDFDRQWTTLGTRFLDSMRDTPPAPVAERQAWLEGHSSHLELSWDQWAAHWRPLVLGALSVPNTRVVLQLLPASGSQRRELVSSGFRLVRSSTRGAPEFAEGAQRAALPTPSEWWAAGCRRNVAPSFRLDLDEAERRMDPKDRGEYAESDEAKRARSHLPVPWDPTRWVDTGLPEWIETFMREGVRIRPEVEPPPFDHPFYKWDSDEALMRAIHEADRHLLVGALEYVPDEEVAEVAATSVVHPWVVVPQAGGKWRLCHDYSVGSNLYVRSAPFTLPTPWDVRRCLRPGSRFAKYDIRDGFFHVPVHPDSRHMLVVRHPGTGRLMRAARLPFGYVDSPRLFCAVMEAMADKLRRKAAALGGGMHFFVFVDDWLCVGDTDALTRQACELLEQELRDRGIAWAPHKHRGPADVMEFLGLMLANLDGVHSLSLTRKRRDGLLALISEWESWGAARETQPMRADPRTLASLLGEVGVCLAGSVEWKAIHAVYRFPSKVPERRMSESAPFPERMLFTLAWDTEVVISLVNQNCFRSYSTPRKVLSNASARDLSGSSLKGKPIISANFLSARRPLCPANVGSSRA